MLSKPGFDDGNEKAPHRGERWLLCVSLWAASARWSTNAAFSALMETSAPPLRAALPPDLRRGRTLRAVPGEDTETVLMAHSCRSASLGQRAATPGWRKAQGIMGWVFFITTAPSCRPLLLIFLIGGQHSFCRVAPALDNLLPLLLATRGSYF